MSENIPDNSPPETENHDSFFIEFTDANLIQVPPDTSFIDVIRRANEHRKLHSSCAERAELAECLLEQAILFKSLKRFADASPKVEEAAQLFERAGLFRRVADCFRVAADIHRGLGDVESSLDYLRKEEEIRRRLAA